MKSRTRTGWAGLLASFALELSLLTAALPACAQPEPMQLWGTGKPCTKEDLVARSRECGVVDLTSKGLTPETLAIRVWLPGLQARDFIRSRFSKTSGGFVWQGVGSGGWSGTVAVFNQAVAAEFIGPRGHAYGLRFTPARSYVVEELDMSKIEAEERKTSLAEPPPSLVPPCTTDPPNRVDALILYTNKAMLANGTDDHIKARIHQALWYTNWAFADSGVDLQITPVLVAQVNYNGETCDNGQACPNGLILGDLTDPGPSADDANSLDNITRPGGMRDTTRADIVVLVVENGLVAGLSNPMVASNYGPNFQSQAFAVVPQAGLTGSGNYYFAHEVGHLMGSAHATGPSGVFGDSRGFVGSANVLAGPACASAWSTVMAMSDCGGCPTLPSWSNPQVKHCDLDMGLANANDNARSLTQTRALVANFRCGPTALPGNVWMRDTWEDSGAEPDPSQAGAPMWLSPYIWVRNEEDLALQHQHEHQNPKFGQTNWVYLKLHNSGATTNGKLELYYANASTNLSWPSGWTLILAEAVSSFGAQSTKIVKIAWADLPGQGHFCLLARWISADDPMTTAETSNIEVNTRGNNNIVWRNLHIIDMADSKSASADLLIGGMNESKSRFELAIRAPANLRGRSFFDIGTVAVELEDGLACSARTRAARRSGLKSVRGKAYVVGAKDSAGIPELTLQAKSKHRVHLSFRLHKTLDRSGEVFRVDVTQTQLLEGKRTLVGAVSYEVHAGR